MFKSIFLNRHSELRSGWRILLFCTILGVIAAAGIVPLDHFGMLNMFVEALILLAAAVAATYCMTRFINRKPFKSVGFSLHPGVFREVGSGCLLGFLMTTGIFLIEFGLGFIHLSSLEISASRIAWAIGSSLMIFAAGACVEELLFRGYLFQTLMQGVTFLPAMLLMATFFALAHAQNPKVSVFGLINVAFAAIWFSFAYLKTRSLWLPIALHFSWNFCQTTLYSFPTSGIAFQEQKIFSLVQTGPDWITGGSFGPEGGALATLALLICTVYILKASYLSAPEGILTLDSVEDLLPPPS